MPLDASLQGALTAPTLTSLRGYFEQATHRPSHGHWQALGDIAETLEAMANGTADAKIYLSAIDPWRWQEHDDCALRPRPGVVFRASRRGDVDLRRPAE